MLSQKEYIIIDRDNFKGKGIKKAIEIVSRKNKDKAQGTYV